MDFSSALLPYFVAVTSIFTIILILYFRHSFSYFKRLGIPHEFPKLIFGNIKSPLVNDKNMFYMVADIYSKFKKKREKLFGFYLFATPIYVPIDLNLIKNILAKDFNHFINRAFYSNAKDDPLSENLFTMEGYKWRPLRAKLTPTFTSGKMKIMFPILVQIGAEMSRAIDQIIQYNKPINIKEIVARFGTDVIGSCAFGVECNSFTETEPEFRKYGRMIFERTPLETFKLLLGFNYPKLSRKLGLKLFRSEITDFFFGAIKHNVKHRSENNISRNDFLQLMIELAHQHSLTVEEIAAQSLLFFAAGFETSSTTLAFCLFELAQRQDIQDKVREEIVSVMGENSGELSYEGLSKMVYTSQVLDETLRKYPPLGVLDRRCTIPYKIGGTDIVIQPETIVFIPVEGIHKDPEYYPEPNKFNPDRFSEENRSKIPPFAYLPFGDGYRNCIGLRFGLMQIKVGLCTILKSFEVSLNPKTPKVLRINPNSPVTQSFDTIWLDAKKIC